MSRPAQLLLTFLVLAISTVAHAQTEVEPSKEESAEPSGQEPPGAAPAKETESDPLSGSFSLTPRVVLVVNGVYGDGLLLPGSFGLFAVRPVVGGNQFELSPSNSTLGFTAAGVSAGSMELTAALDITLKNPTPLVGSNVLAPQFYSAFMEAAFENLLIRLGQFPDVVLPFVVQTTNGFPGSYLPGQLGFTRPQLRADARLPVGTTLQVLVQGSLGRPIQTFQLTDELLGAGAGLPDGQARIAVAGGRPVEGLRSWRLAYELGLSGHLGRRRFAEFNGMDLRNREFDTWSAGADVRANLPTGTVLHMRLWRGSLLGDYMGGVFQTLSTQLLEPVRAQGFLFTARQQLGGGWTANVGFGRDNPRDGDVGTGERSLNQAGFANVFWNWSRTIGFALEGSRWRTSYEGQGSTRIWRGEFMTILRL